MEAATSGPAPSSLLPEALQELGERLLAEAKSGPPTNETALTLLAADALITYACEAISELDPAGLSRIQ